MSPEEPQQLGFQLPGIRSWSKEKLDLLGKYLRAYSRIMNSQKQGSQDKKGWLRGYSYIDAFAGPGEFLDEEAETREYVKGSPKVALECQPPFDDYWFIDLSRERLNHLERTVRSAFPNSRVHFEQGDANRVLREKVIPAITSAAPWRAVVFLDPFGLEVDFATVQQLAAAGVFDVFINFSVMGITRLLDREQSPSEQNLDIVYRVMGEVDWVRDLYFSQESFWGETRTRRSTLKAQTLAAHYLEKLNELFSHVSKPVLMRNSRGSPLYALVLGSHNPTAAKITTDIFRRYEALRARAG